MSGSAITYSTTTGAVSVMLDSKKVGAIRHFRNEGYRYCPIRSGLGWQSLAPKEQDQ